MVSSTVLKDGTRMYAYILFFWTIIQVSYMLLLLQNIMCDAVQVVVNHVGYTIMGTIHYFFLSSRNLYG